MPALSAATTAASDQVQYVGLIFGALVLSVAVAALMVLLLWRRGRQKVSLLHKHTALMCTTKTSALPVPGQAVSMKDLKLTPVIGSNGHVFNRCVCGARQRPPALPSCVLIVVTELVLSVRCQDDADLVHEGRQERRAVERRRR